MLTTVPAKPSEGMPAELDPGTAGRGERGRQGVYKCVKDRNQTRHQMFETAQTAERRSQSRPLAMSAATF